MKPDPPVTRIVLMARLDSRCFKSFAGFAFKAATDLRGFSRIKKVKPLAPKGPPQRSLGGAPLGVFAMDNWRTRVSALHKSSGTGEDAHPPLVQSQGFFC